MSYQKNMKVRLLSQNDNLKHFTNNKTPFYIHEIYDMGEEKAIVLRHENGDVMKIAILDTEITLF